MIVGRARETLGGGPIPLTTLAEHLQYHRAMFDGTSTTANSFVPAYLSGETDPRVLSGEGDANTNTNANDGTDRYA